MLPSKKREALVGHIGCLLVLSAPKTGKTSNLLALEGNLVLDLQDRAAEYGGLYINYMAEAKRRFPKAPFWRAMELYHTKVVDALDAKSQKLGGPAYPYVTIDTIKELERIAAVAVDRKYRRTVTDSNEEDDAVRDWGYGKGIHALRGILERMYEDVKRYCSTVIITSHLRQSKEVRGEDEVDVTDIDMFYGGPTLRNMVTGNMATDIGMLYRKSAGINVLSFKRKGESIIGASAEHLREKAFIISDYTGNEKKHYWNKIFL